MASFGRLSILVCSLAMRACKAFLTLWTGDLFKSIPPLVLLNGPNLEGVEMGVGGRSRCFLSDLGMVKKYESGPFLTPILRTILSLLRG
jgi:hypothetical protein